MSFFIKLFISFILLLPLPISARESKVYSTKTPYLCGHKFKKSCRLILDEYGWYVNPEGRPGYIFVKTDYIDLFFKHFLPVENFILVTHNSDFSINGTHLEYLKTENLARWYAVNAAIEHPKLKPIPIGLCNFSNFDLFGQAAKKNHQKKTVVYANYSLVTNKKERSKCLQLTQVKMAEKKPFEQFLEAIGESYFVLSPEGNGIDCHRTWEALYLKAIPIVTKSPQTEAFKDFPILVIDGWEDFKSLDLTPRLYEEMWNDFDLNNLDVENLLI